MKACGGMTPAMAFVKFSRILSSILSYVLTLTNNSPIIALTTASSSALPSAVLQRTHPAPSLKNCRYPGFTVPLLFLASLVLCSSCSERGHRARVAVPREQEWGRVRWKRRAYLCQIRVQVGHGCEQGVVALVLGRRWGLRVLFCFFVSVSVFVTASPVRFCFSAFSATVRLSGLGVIPVEKSIH